MRNARAASGSSCVSTARTATLSFAATKRRSGSACFGQAEHHDAQTVTTTGLPSSLPRPTIAPVVTSAPLKRTSGPLSGWLAFVAAVSAERESSPPTSMTAAAAAATPASRAASTITITRAEGTALG